MKQLSKKQAARHHQRAVMTRIDEPHVSAQYALTLVCRHLSRLSRAVAWLLAQETEKQGKRKRAAGVPREAPPR